MGMWGDDPEGVDVAAIAEEMRQPLYLWMSGHIRIYDPRGLTTTDYDPSADTGATTTRELVYDSGPSGAIVQPIRSPARIEFGSQSQGILGIRFQAKKIGDVALRAGLIVRVVDGGEDQALSEYSFAIQGSVNSTFKWGDIIEASVITGGS